MLARRKAMTSAAWLERRKSRIDPLLWLDCSSFFFVVFVFVVLFESIKTGCLRKHRHPNGNWRPMKSSWFKNVPNYVRQPKLSFSNVIEIRSTPVYLATLWVVKHRCQSTCSQLLSSQVDPQNVRLYAYQQNSYRYLYTSPRILLAPALFVLVGGLIQYFAQKQRVGFSPLDMFRPSPDDSLFF